jgi:predicted O-methyltransferase YrrM
VPLYNSDLFENRRKLIYDIYKLRENHKMNIHVGAETGVYEVAEDFLLACAKLLLIKARSLETGIGFSTAIFASFGWKHIGISPVEEEIQNFKKFLRYMKKNTYTKPKLICDNSFEVFKKLKFNYKFDFILIDGNHAFPHVMLDFFYTSQMLKIGGFLALDDINLPGPKIVLDYALTRPYWSVWDQGEKWVILQLVAECRVATEDWNS